MKQKRRDCGPINNQQRFLEVMGFRTPDRIPQFCFFQRFETGTWERWQREGLPRDVHAIQYFNFARMDLIPVKMGPVPDYEQDKQEKLGVWRIAVDRGFQAEIQDALEMLAQEFPIEERRDWTVMRRLLDPMSPARYPRFWEDYCRIAEGRDYPLGVSIPGLFNNLRQWIGVRTLSYSVRHDRAWVAEMVEYMGSFAVEVLQKVTQDLALDFATFEETSAYRIPDVVSMPVFREIFLPKYRRIVDCLHSGGVNHILVEGQGNVSDLIPLWLDVGIKGIYFLEVGAGLDALELRRRYGKQLVFIGNIDHHTLTAGKRDINDELMAKVPALLEEGGYMPAVDRPVSSDVSFDNYRYYLDRLEQIAH